MSDADALLDEFAVRWARGENPDVREYLDRAGDERERLAQMIDALLVAVPAPPADPELERVMAAWMSGEPPLLEIRRIRGRSREDVVTDLSRSLDIPPDLRTKLGDRYHQLETGLLPVGRVHRSVLAAVAAALSVRIDQVAAWAGVVTGPQAELRLMRAPATSVPLEGMPAPAAPAAAAGSEPTVAHVPGPDMVDHLFGTT